VVPESIDPDALTLAIARLASAVGPEKDSPKAHELAPELAVLDVEELKSQVAYDSELLIELIDLYLSERARQSQEMAAALAGGKCDDLSRIAHTIKGSLGSLHADAARSTAQALELAARDHDSAKCHDFLPYFERQLDQLEKQLLLVKRSLTS
jgi:HPt (histidine-containing phosphotransfer) domain-containing protein